MLYFYQLGEQIIGWLQKLASLFTVPMSSPEFLNAVGLGGDAKGIISGIFSGLANPVLRLIISFAGDLTFLEFFMSTGFFIFFGITFIKWCLPTS